MTIIEKKNVIYVTKAEYAKAMKVGTDEFEELFKARQMYPNAKVVIKKSNNKQNYSKLTKKFMLEYVEATDKGFHDELKEMFASIGKVRFDEMKNEVITVSFFYVREKFLNRYPQFMTEKDRKKYEAAKADKNKSEETSNVIDMTKIS